MFWCYTSSVVPGQAYGMATWDCFRKPLDKGGLQLQRIVKLAQGVAGLDHGFRCSPGFEAPQLLRSNLLLFQHCPP